MKNIPIAGNIIRSAALPTAAIVVLQSFEDRVVLPSQTGIPKVFEYQALVSGNSSTEFSRDGGKTWEKVTLE